MNFTFENTITADAGTYNVQLNGENIGCVFEDKKQKLWAAICINSPLRESEVWTDRESAAQHLAKKAGKI